MISFFFKKKKPNPNPRIQIHAALLYTIHYNDYAPGAHPLYYLNITVCVAWQDLMKLLVCHFLQQKLCCSDLKNYFHFVLLCWSRTHSSFLPCLWDYIFSAILGINGWGQILSASILNYIVVPDTVIFRHDSPESIFMQWPGHIIKQFFVKISTDVGTGRLIQELPVFCFQDE